MDTKTWSTRDSVVDYTKKQAPSLLVFCSVYINYIFGLLAKCLDAEGGLQRADTGIEFTESVNLWQTLASRQLLLIPADQRSCVALF